VNTICQDKRALDERIDRALIKQKQDYEKEMVEKRARVAQKRKEREEAEMEVQEATTLGSDKDETAPLLST
jgi:hypothetical protein